MGDLSLEGLKNKIRYDTKQRSDSVEITAYLPPGFTMREYTRVFFLKDAGTGPNALQEFLIMQQNAMFVDLVARIPANRMQRLIARD
jgi:hypothetical protein